jgi:hypothetical protein
MPETMTTLPPHPMQPLVLDRGLVRFRGNPIVRFLLDHGGYDMNALAAMPFSDDDREQFAQLIGYSVRGFGELSYVSDRTYAKASRAAAKLVAEAPHA